MVDGQPVDHVFGKLPDIAAVRLRQDNLVDTRSSCRDDFFTNSADREYLTRQGKLTGHRNGAVAALLASEGEQCARHADPS